jgi:hypothetical protein
MDLKGIHPGRNALYSEEKWSGRRFYGRAYFPSGTNFKIKIINYQQAENFYETDQQKLFEAAENFYETDQQKLFEANDQSHR